VARKLPRFSAALATFAFYAGMGAGVWLMLSASVSYLELGRRHPFFLEKLPLAHPRWWLAALYVHVPSALFALPACLVLTARRVRLRFPRVHRWLGRVTGALVLLAVVPSGMYLACFARGGWPSTLGFWLTGLITSVAMAKSIARAREGRMRDHRRMSAHVTAQLAVAVVSRVLLAGAEQLGVYGDWVYVAALLLPIFGCAFVAELTIRSGSLRLVKGSRHEALVAVSAVRAVRWRRPGRAAVHALD
jgi:hypothetical protein